MLSELWNVTPGFAGDNFLDKRDGYAKTFGNINVPDTFTRQLSDLRDFGGIQFGARIGRAILTSLPVLLVSVIHVVLVRAKKEMRRIATRSAVTLMAHLHSVWNWAEVNLPGNALGVSGYAINFQKAIAISGKAGCPVPTIIRAANINLLPEFIFNGSRGLVVSSVSRQKAHRLSFDAPSGPVSIVGQIRGAAAATFAEFYSGIVRSIMGLHEKLILSCAKPGTIHSRRLALCIGS